MSDLERQFPNPVRVDVWAWSVRLLKTRSLVATACKSGHLTVNGQRCRPARKVRVGDTISVRKGVFTRTVEVKALLERRVGASLVEEFLIDRTPQDEYERASEFARAIREGTLQREVGTGRPTKKDRRDLDELMNDLSEEKEDFDRLVKAFTKKQ